MNLSRVWDVGKWIFYHYFSNALDQERAAKAAPSRNSTHAHDLYFTTLLLCSPSFSTPQVTTSPGLRNICGFIPRPTPEGVPVKITSPG